MRKLENDEYLEHIYEYVRKYGKVDGCTADIPLCQDTVTKALNPQSKYSLPEFANEVEQARKDYKILHKHPSEDPTIRKATYEQLKAMVIDGYTNTVEVTGTDKNGNIIKSTKTSKKSGIPAWVWYVVFPEKQFTEESLLFVISNQKQDLIQNEPEGVECILKWLTDFERRAIEDLLKRGIQPKKLKL